MVPVRRRPTHQSRRATRGSARQSQMDSAGDRAACADRLARLEMRGRDLTWRLSNRDAPWIINLPPDTEIVACRTVADVVVFILRSERFPRIAQGAVIPAFTPDWNGLKWSRRSAVTPIRKLSGRHSQSMT